MKQEKIEELLNRFSEADIKRLKACFRGFHIQWDHNDLKQYMKQWYQEHHLHITWQKDVFKPVEGFEFLADDVLWNKVAESFGTVGPDYWGWFGKQLVAYSDVQTNHQVLDIGFGRGASLFAAAENGAFVTGIEASKSMVYHTEKQLKIHHKIKLLHVDAKEFDYQTYDRIHCGFGLGYLLEDDLLLKLKRALKSGGRLVFSSWGKQDDQPLITGLVNQYLKLEDSPPSPLTRAEGIKAHLSPFFEKIHIVPCEHVFYFKDTDQWWQDLNRCAVKGVLHAIEETGQLPAFENDMKRMIKRFESDEGLGILRRAFIVICEV